MPMVPSRAGGLGRSAPGLRRAGCPGPLHHRQVKIPDLLIAAVAARNGLTLLHYDSDYDIIAGVTGQPTHWAAPRGSL